MIRKGTYVLFLTVSRDSTIRAGSLGDLRIPAGEYCYVGSAMNGIDQRLERHLSKDKRMRWHIDYLTMCSECISAFESYPDHIPECELAGMVEAAGSVPVFKGFGCSDCRCWTHLFRVTDASKREIVSSERLTMYRQHPAYEHNPYKI